MHENWGYPHLWKHLYGCINTYTQVFTCDYALYRLFREHVDVHQMFVFIFPLSKMLPYKTMTPPICGALGLVAWPFYHCMWRLACSLFARRFV